MVERASPRSILAVDFGSARSHGALIEPVEGVYRLIAHADVPTVRAPYVDLRESLRLCVARLEELAERPLLAPDGAPLMPQQGRHGVDALVATASAAPPLDCALIGLTGELSVSGGLAACRASHAAVRASIALAQDEAGRRNALAALRAQPPEVIVLVGGVDGAPTRLLVEAANILATLFADLAPAQRPAVIMAGNPEARRPIAQALGDGWDYDIVENVQPALRAWQPQELQRELAQRYARRKLSQLAGYDALATWAAVPILASDAGAGTILQLLSRQEGAGRRVLGLDVGASQATAALATEGYTWSRRARAGAAHDLPTGADPWTQYVAAQEALAAALGDLARLLGESPEEGWGVDLIAARGGALVHAGGAPWATALWAALAMLDAVQPHGVTHLALDGASVWPQLGALAQIEPLAALQVLRRDGLLELGAALSLPGQGRAGQRAGRLRLTPEAGEAVEIEIAWGGLQRLSLPQGAKAALAFEPAPHTGLEPIPAGRVIVRGGSLGLIVDARGRPLALPEEPGERRRVVEAWAEGIA
jgi:hypothetical protein